MGIAMTDLTDRLLSAWVMATDTFGPEYHAIRAELDRLAARVAELERLAPMCKEHGTGSGTRSGCPYCSLIKQHQALSKIDYLCGPPNDQEVSAYDIHCDEDAVVVSVDRLAGENKRLREALEWYASNGKQMFYAPDSIGRSIRVDFTERAKAALAGDKP